MSVPSTPTSTERPRVLVIDDDPLFRSLLLSLLRKDYMVAVASEGSEGYYKAMEFPPDVAIIDVQMAGWDGIRTVHAFRSHPVLQKAALIMLTSDASRETVLAAIQAGADDYIIKTSFSRNDLQQKLAKYDPRKRDQLSPSERPAAPPASGSLNPEDRMKDIIEDWE